MANKSKHVFSLKSHEPFHASDLGSLTKVTKDELPILKNLSIKRLVIAPGAIREPHVSHSITNQNLFPQPSTH